MSAVFYYPVYFCFCFYFYFCIKDGIGGIKQKINLYLIFAPRQASCIGHLIGVTASSDIFQYPGGTRTVAAWTEGERL